MHILGRIASTKRNIHRGALSLILASGLLLVSAAAFADDPTTMAPPVQTSAPQERGDDASADSVFNWKEVPANQQVILTRAAFDQGGYQLYDTVGETIVVPFTNQNLYVMKFAPSDNGKMYFVNSGDYPILYLPKNGYLENAAVAGARWYPFGKDFRPTHPVFLGIAPSWSVFIGMGWYPHMAFYGCYWSHTSFIAGGIFLPSVGLYFDIGGHPYYGWDGYHGYLLSHPDFYRVDYAHRAFGGGDGFGGAHAFRGTSGGFGGHGGGFGSHGGFGGFGGHGGFGGGHGGFGGGHGGFGGGHFRG